MIEVCDEKSVGDFADCLFGGWVNGVFGRGFLYPEKRESKNGKRYYYPASQEYGFQIGRRKRVPGLYYMRDSAAVYYSEHENAIVAATLEILEDL